MSKKTENTMTDYFWLAQLRNQIEMYAALLRGTYTFQKGAIEEWKEGLKAVIEAQMDRIDEEETGWISVEKALPKTEEYVLVTAKTKKGFRSINIAHLNLNGRWVGRGSMAGVTAWRYMPEPYEEEETP